MEKLKLLALILSFPFFFLGCESDTNSKKNIKEDAGDKNTSHAIPVKEVQKIFATNGRTYDHFGYSLATNGEVILVGAPNKGNGCKGLFPKNSCRGTVQVFSKDENSWVHSYDIIPNEVDGSFGMSLAIQDSVAVVGANRGNYGAGACYVLINNGVVFNIYSKLTGSASNPGDLFGESVSIFGNFIAVGAPDANDEEGEVYIFQKSDEGWVESALLKPVERKNGIRFGRSVSLFGNLLAVGTIYDDINGEKSGSVSLFEFDGSKWSFIETITPSDGKSEARFGRSISLFENSLLVGAVFDGMDCQKCGAAYVFQLQDEKWIEQRLLPSNLKRGANFGSSVALFNDYAVVGAEGFDENGQSSGKAYLFKFDIESGKWLEVCGFIGGKVNKKDFFGTCDIYQDIVIVGADFSDGSVSESGAVFVFEIQK